ncbi:MULTISPECIES: hypothetical protein [Rhizobium/Agrobacterium group]|uniref:Uncharacterized protein n=2 Tax=Neorhizobium TaxID=1525371 RepID=A0ABV0M9N2_9HYPH|nr:MULTISPECIES: hypothetical protein [Rhizobium/Agrobacterium group]KGD98158.1 hypothetical protein JL39_14710 [Rhizobium sp. YS-1r]MCC2613232.1 hypothetical protein [Neorhizobium petrolearium]WGI68322.1 hypothetical protein QEO92_25760 [Neorhizobium petrolearium]
MDQTKPIDGQRRAGAATDLEARVVVLEILSMTALALAMDTSEDADVGHARGIASLVLETVRQRCDEMGMTADARLSARSYADQLLSTALLSLYPDSPREH